MSRAGFRAAGGAGGPEEAETAAVAAGATGDLDGHLPHVLDRPRVHAVRAHAGGLALAAVDRAAKGLVDVARQLDALYGVAEDEPAEVIGGAGGRPGDRPVHSPIPDGANRFARRS